LLSYGTWLGALRDRKMHVLLQPAFPTKFAVASGALWCAWTVAAMLARATENNAPPPTAVDPPAPFVVTVRTIPIIPEAAFADRWQVPAPIPAPAPAAESQQFPIKLTPAPRQAEAHAERSERDICTRHRMHKVITRGGKSWRCRR
jgi:hypothetical protein